MNYDNDDYTPMDVGDGNSFIEQLNGRIDAYYLLRRLPPRHRKMVELKAQGYNYREIGELLGKSENAIQKTFWRIRKKYD